jgi:hypothetical protein
MTVRARHLPATATLLAGALSTTALLAAPATAADGGRPLSTTLTGSTEVPGPGDPDGSGTASLRVNPGQGQVCYELMVEGIAPAAAAHIHQAPAGTAGPIVVGLMAPTNGASSGCVDVGRELAREILKNPADYYVNVHNAEFPAGALRGQLSR